jgi:hypothetical protein
MELSLFNTNKVDICWILGGWVCEIRTCFKAMHIKVKNYKWRWNNQEKYVSPSTPPGVDFIKVGRMA